jgi:signal transduction histidine kinase
MKKRITLLFFYLSICTLSNTYSQTFKETIDSMLGNLEAVTDHRGRVDILNEVAYSYRRLSPDSVLLYSNRAIALANKIGYKKGLSFAYKNKGIGFYKLGIAPDTVIYYYQKAIDYAEEVDDYYTQAACYNNIGLVGVAELTYNESIQYFLKGIGVFDAHIPEENRLKALMLGNIGTAYHRDGDNKRGIRYYEESLAMAKRIGDKSIPSIFVDELARARMEEGDIEGALRDITELMPLHDEIGDFESKAETLLTLAEVKMEMGLYRETIKYGQEAYTIAVERGFSRIQSRSLIWMAYGLKGIGNLSEAIATAKEALAIAELGFSLELQSRAVSILANAYSELGDYQKAYEYADYYNRLVKQRQDQEKQRITDELEAKYQNEKQLLEISELKEEKEAQERRLYGLVALVLLVVSVLGVMIYNIRQKNKATEALNEKNVALQAAEQSLFDKNQELERYIESNLQLENFAHLASHDLREPMRNIVSFSQLLEKSGKEKLSERELEYLGFIRKGTRRIEGLVKDLLDYSTITHTPLEITNISMLKLIEEVNSDIRQLLNEKGGAIIVQELPEHILADSSRMYQLLQNLLTNALRYSRDGVAPEIVISGEEGSTHYHFEIADNGIGIEAEFFDQIFVLFKTLENKSISNSSGIGLATCKKVVEDHKGKIWLESKIGEGTTFYFTIAKNLG